MAIRLSVGTFFLATAALAAGSAHLWAQRSVVISPAGVSVMAPAISGNGEVVVFGDPDGATQPG